MRELSVLSLLSFPLLLPYLFSSLCKVRTFRLNKTKQLITTNTDMDMDIGMAPSSAELIGSNLDFMTEVLLPLPLKSLMRCKLVSKSWCALISSPHFSLLRTQTLQQRCSLASGLFLHMPSQPEKIQIQYIPIHRVTIPPFGFLDFSNCGYEIQPSISKILKSCNGLLLCRSVGPCIRVHFRDRSERGTSYKYHVYNPTTNQYATLPTLRGFDDFDGIDLAFDPSKSPYYKVVVLRRFNPGMLLPHELRSFRIHVYSSETMVWKISGFMVEQHYPMKIQSGVFWNGAIYWLNPGLQTSLCFDVDNESLHEWPSPPFSNSFKHSLESWYFGESRGHLHFIELYDYSRFQFDVYEMDRDGFKWFHKYNVDLDNVHPAIPTVPNLNFECLKFFVLCLIEGEGEEHSSLIIYVPGRIISYNFMEETSKKLCDFELCFNDLQCLQEDGHGYVQQYIETIFNP